MVSIEQDTAILFGMCMAVLALLGLLAYVVDDLIRTKTALHESDDEAWRDQVQATVTYVGNVLVAERIRELARNYESPDHVLLRQRLGRTKWKEGGTPLPALWLEAVADQISPPLPEVGPEYNLAGERVL